MSVSFSRNGDHGAEAQDHDALRYKYAKGEQEARTLAADVGIVSHSS